MMLLVLACASTAEPAPAPSADAFWRHWGDAKAEISSYDLVQPRYGSTHPGQAVLIYVTEDFSWSDRVKADRGAHPDNDIRPVLKLNATRDFLTGIYPYHVMTSVFARVDAGDGMRALDPLKISFSAQEWCGMTYQELIVSPGKVKETLHTYFDSDDRPPGELDLPGDTLYADMVPILVRGLRGDWLAPGESRTFRYLPALLAQRFAHVAPRLGKATVTRHPAQGAEERWEVAVEGGETTTWRIGAQAPHKVLGWSTTDGEVATLRGSDRLPYWEMHDPDDVPARSRVGL